MYMKKALIFALALLTSIALALDVGRALSKAEGGNPALPPMQVMLVVDYNAPLLNFGGDRFVLPLVRMMMSDLYDLTDLLSKEANLKVVLAVSPTFLDQVKAYSISGYDDLMREGYSGELLHIFSPPGSAKSLREWNFKWLPPSIKKDLNPNASMKTLVALYRMMAASLLGKLIAIHEYGKLEVAAIPGCGCALSLCLSRGMEEVVDGELSNAYEEISTIFGSVEGLYPPLLDVSPTLIRKVAEKGFKWTFAPSLGLAEVITFAGVKVIPVNVDISRAIVNIKNESDLVEFLSRLHRMQRSGVKFLAIKIDAIDWMFSDFEIKEGILEALAKDEYLSIVMPNDVNSKGSGGLISSSEVGNAAEWFSKGAVLKGFERTIGAFETYERVKKYLSESIKTRLVRLLGNLMNVEFYKALSVGDERSIRILDAYDYAMKEVIKLLGENAEGFESIKTALQKVYYLRVVYTDFANLNGVEDEGYWKYAQRFDGKGLVKYMKVVPVNRGLALSVAFGKEARNFIGSSYSLSIVLGQLKFKIYFKIWDGKWFVYKKEEDKWVLYEIKSDIGSIWDVVELNLNEVDFPIKISLALEDTRRHVEVERIPKKGFLVVNRE